MVKRSLFFPQELLGWLASQTPPRFSGGFAPRQYVLIWSEHEPCVTWYVHVPMIIVHALGLPPNTALEGFGYVFYEFCWYSVKNKVPWQTPLILVRSTGDLARMKGACHTALQFFSKNIFGIGLSFLRDPLEISQEWRVFATLLLQGFIIFGIDMA